MATAYISLGSNIEPKLAHLEAGLRGLSRGPLRLAGISSIYRTAPVDYTQQDSFLNCVAAVETALSPEALLRRLQDIEADEKKKVPFRWGPRTLDMDLVLFEQETRDTEDLQLPHPRMDQRAFVLVPLAEVAPLARHPGNGKTAAEMLKALPQPQPEVVKVRDASQIHL